MRTRGFGDGGVRRGWKSQVTKEEKMILFVGLRLRRRVRVSCNVGRIIGRLLRNGDLQIVIKSGTW